MSMHTFGYRTPTPYTTHTHAPADYTKMFTLHGNADKDNIFGM